MNYRNLSILLCLATSTLLPAAKADDSNKETIVTLNSSVRVPGKVLAPGTYVFKLLDNSSDRNVVLIYNQNEDELIATILAIPAYRIDVSDQTILTFDDPEAAVPMVKKWFYPGQNDGLEFVYTRESKEATAPVSNLQTTAAAPSSVSGERTQLPPPPAVQDTAAADPSRIEALNIATENHGSEASAGTDSADRSAGQEPASLPADQNTGSSDSDDTPGEPPAALPETAQNVMLLPLMAAALVGLGLTITCRTRRTA